MNRLMKIGIAVTINSVLLLFLNGWFAFGDCFGSECNESIYNAISIAAIVSALLGAVILLVGTGQNVRQNPSKWLQLVLLILLYSACALWAYYKFGGGQEFLKERRVRSQFSTTLYKIGELPAGYSEANSRYYHESEGGFFGPGTYIETIYEKNEFTNTSSAHIGGFTLKQGDANNNAAGILPSCTEDPSDCEIVDGKNVKNIHCFINKSYLCSVVINGTYVSVTADSDSGFTREQSLSVIDSLVPR